MAKAICDGLRLEAIAADIAGDGDTALELLRLNAYDIAVLDRDIPGPRATNRRTHRRCRQRHADPDAHRCRPARRQGPGSGWRRRLPHQAVRTPRTRAPSQGAGPQTRAPPAARARDRRPAAGPVPARGLSRRPLRSADQEAVRRARSPRRCRRRCRQRGRAAGTSVGPDANPFTNAMRITVSALRKRLGEPWMIATVAGVGYRIDTAPDTGRRTRSVDRKPGLSVRLKLTLSYAGFLMVAGVLLLAVVWVFLLRYVPAGANPPGSLGPNRGDLVRAFAPKAEAALGFLLVFGLLGGWLLAGSMLAPLTRITNATRQASTDRLPPDPVGRPKGRVPRARRRLRHHARAARGPGRRTAKIRSQRLPRAAHAPGDHADASRRRPQRSEPRPRRARRRLHFINTRASSSPRPCSCSVAPTNGPSPRNTSTCPSWRKRRPSPSSPLRKNAASPSRPPERWPRPSARRRSCSS